jgi:hypothetical protein
MNTLIKKNDVLCLQYNEHEDYKEAFYIALEDFDLKLIIEYIIAEKSFSCDDFIFDYLKEHNLAKAVISNRNFYVSSGDTCKDTSELDCSDAV